MNVPMFGPGHGNRFDDDDHTTTGGHLFCFALIVAMLIGLAVVVSGCSGPTPTMHPIVENTLARGRFYCPGLEYDAEVSEEAQVALREVVTTEGLAWREHWELDAATRAILMDTSVSADDRMAAIRAVQDRRGRVVYRSFNEDLPEAGDDYDPRDGAPYRTGVTTWSPDDCPSRLWGAVAVETNVLWPEYGDQLHIVMGVVE